MKNKDFKYICMAEDGKPTEFSILANIVADHGDRVEIERYQRFGKLDIGNANMSIENFEDFYDVIDDEISKKLKSKNASRSDYER